MKGEELEALLESLAEPDFREFTSKLMPGTDNILGVRIPKLRKIAKDITKEDWRAFLTYPSHSFEHSIIRGVVIATAPMETDERLRLTEMYIPEITNWALNDTFCNSWKVRKQDAEKVFSYCLALVDRHEEFPSRVGAVMLMSHFLDEEFKTEYLSWVAAEKGEHYYIKMMVAWFFATALAKQWDATLPYIENKVMDKWVHNKAIQKAIESYRVSDTQKSYLRTLKQ